MVVQLPPSLSRTGFLKDECDPREVTLFVDAFWSLESTSGGGIVSWLNCYIKAFSRNTSAWQPLIPECIGLSVQGV